MKLLGKQMKTGRGREKTGKKLSAVHGNTEKPGENGLGDLRSEGNYHHNGNVETQNIQLTPSWYKLLLADVFSCHYLIPG